MKNYTANNSEFSNQQIIEFNMVRDGIYNFEKFKNSFYCYEKRIKKSNKLIFLNLSSNLIDDELMEKIFNFKIANYKINLYSLNISYNRITPIGLEKLLDFLANCPNFNNLVCEYNLFNEKDFYDILIKSKLSNELKNKFIYHDW